MQILLADANPEVRAALRLVLEQAGHQVAGESRDAINLMAQIARHCPDAVILDSDLPGIPTGRRSTLSTLADLCETLRLLCPGMRLVALSSRPEVERELSQARIDVFICKSDPPEGLEHILSKLGL